MDKIYRGIIKDFKGSWRSGVAILILCSDNNVENHIYCENASTVRALNAMFPGFITEGHTADPEVIKGKVIYYSIDCGLLDWILPEEYADFDFIEQYSKQNN